MYIRELPEMSLEKNRYKATIAGSVYTIIGTETREHMDMVTKLVNDQVSDIKKLVPKTTTEQAAMLEAINAVSDQLKKQTELLTMKKEMEDLQEKVKKVDELEKKIERLEERERLARESLLKDGATETAVTEQVEAQQVLNNQAKKNILETNGSKRPMTPFEAKQGKLDI
jgi:cell division protein ZapA